MNEQWPIYPLVRLTIGKIAGFAARISVAIPVCQVLSLLMVLLLPPACESMAFACYCTADALFYLLLALLVLLALWCHNVLLAGRGFAFTRFLLLFGIFLALTMLVSMTYSFFTGTLLLARQYEIPFILWVLLSCSLLLNLGNMAALPAKGRWLIGGYMLLLLLILLTKDTPLLPLCILFEILWSIAGYKLLRRLAAAAPHIISMPERPESASH
jgi:hypothetical protein